MHVSELHVYPIKSARGIPLTRGQLDDRGFQHDRRWMLVDDAGVFISQREQHRMALIDVRLGADGLTVAAPGCEPMTIPLVAAGSTMQCRIWRDEVAAIPVGVAADRWFSNFLVTSCRLVYMPDDARRVVDRKYMRHERIVGFADAYPLLIIGQGSLDHLNEKLVERGETSVPMQRFRPNIVVAGTRPHEEDEWEQIRIRRVEVDVVKPCARCAITTVDGATGTAGKEPLRTLATYRKHGSDVWFGQNAVHRQTASIAINDVVTVTRKRD